MIIPDLLEIAESWHRSRHPTPEQQQDAHRRLQVCNTCPEKMFRPLIRTYTCRACGCVLSKKVYSPRGDLSCPLGKWEDKYTAPPHDAA